MNSRTLVFPFLLLFACTAKKNATPEPEQTGATVAESTRKNTIDLLAHAEKLAKQYIIVDGHVDLPYRLDAGRDKNGNLSEDPSRKTDKGDFDYVRAKAGGLDAPFMSIYVPASFQTNGGAKKKADELIDIVEGLAKRAPDKFAIAHTPAAVRSAFAAGKIAFPLGIENGAAIEDDIKNIEHFHRRGVRYITLTHSKCNQICDSSYDEERKWKGLSPFGRKVVHEMNRVGIMVDVAHLSDKTIDQVLEISAVPVIASHSSCRHYTPDFERNLNDDLVKKIALKGGVVMVNFGSTFISKKSQDYYDGWRKARNAFMESNKLERKDPKVKAHMKAYEASHPRVLATVEDVANHIDHVKQLVGIDHVGFGSDFDGVGDTLPDGLKDVSDYPKLIAALLKRGYSDADIEKICSTNVFRVWEAVEAAAG